MKMILSLLLINLSLMMIFIIHPLSMGMLILIQSLILCMLLGLIYKTYWFSYILFLIFLGGLLVSFIYMTSIASNELFKISMKMKWFIVFSILLSMMINLIFNKNLFWMNFFFNNEMNSFMENFLLMNNENKINLSKLYNNQTFYMMTMLIIYLFISLIAMVKITNIFFGTIRSFN